MKEFITDNFVKILLKFCLRLKWTQECVRILVRICSDDSVVNFIRIEEFELFLYTVWPSRQDW